jgi:RimJ/RimL family protein N-acetyltransferase
MTSSPDLPLGTDRLVLRPYRADDVDATLAYYGDQQASRYLLSDPFTRPDAEQAVSERMKRTDPQLPGERLTLVVEHDGRLIGDVNLELGGPPVSVGEIGWVFDPGAAGQGFATEAARALIELAFDHYGLHRVIAQLDARNTASARMCERLGMTREAHLRQDWYSKGEWTDTLVYAVLRTDDRGSGGRPYGPSGGGTGRTDGTEEG